MNIDEMMDAICDAVDESDEFTHLWYANVAIACQDAVLATCSFADDKEALEHSIRIGDLAARNFMKTAFEIDMADTPGTLH